MLIPLLSLLIAMNVPAQTRTPDLAEWESLQYGMFIHYGMSTFDQSEFNEGKTPASAYHPTHLDTRQWVRVAREAGMKYAVLTAKHTAGFCNWPSGDYDVSESPVKTDVVAEFMKACHEEGIKPGIYYCIMDGHREGGVEWEKPITDDYWALIKKHLTQLHTRYPGIYEQWLDIPGKLSPAQRTELYDLIKHYSPHCLVLMNVSVWTTPGIKVLPAAWPTDLLVGERNPAPAPHDPHKEYEGKPYYLPLECCDTLTENWFWVDGDQPRSVRALTQMWANTVGRGANLLLDVAPDRTGQIPEVSIKRLMEFKFAREHPESQPVNLAAHAAATASNTYQNRDEFGPDRAFDDNDVSRWACDDDQTAAWLQVDLGKPVRIDHCRIAEAFPGRVEAFELQVQTPAGWQTIYQGTHLAAEFEAWFPTVEGRVVRLNILRANKGPTIGEFQLFKSP